jgi:hypothetical protein
MKGTCSFASLVVGALASYDVGPWTYSKSVETTLFNDTVNKITWKLTHYTAYDEDKGIEYVRFQHDLVAPIKGTDEVTFEIAFTTENDPYTNKRAMSEDAVLCKLVRGT